MAGAAGLAGLATLRSGAGLVRLAVADCCLDTVAGFEPSFMTAPLPNDDAGRIAGSARWQLAELTKSASATVVACGPGLSRSPDLDALVAWLYTTLAQPAVFDADALNALAAQPDVLRHAAGPRILTPHPGEFARLVGASRIDSREIQEREAVELAAKIGAVIVLKGHRTLVTDGQRSAHNTTGNPGMATGGSGDVLTGITAALLGQGLPPFDAARLAVYVHGLAGDLAAAELGQVSLIASDLIGFLPAAFQKVTTSPGTC